MLESTTTRRCCAGPSRGAVLISLTFQPGISLNQSSEFGRAAENIVRGVPEVRGVGRRTGRAELDEHAEGVHRSELDVDLAPSARPRAAVLADLRDRLAVLPGAVSLGQPISHRLEHMLSGVQAQIALKVFGDDLDTLRTLAETISGRPASVPGLVDLQLQRQVRVPQLRIAIDHERASLYGVSTAALLEKMQALTGGVVVSQILEGSPRYDLVVLDVMLPGASGFDLCRRLGTGARIGWAGEGAMRGLAPGSITAGNRRPAGHRCECG